MIKQYLKVYKEIIIQQVQIKQINSFNQFKQMLYVYEGMHLKGKYHLYKVPQFHGNPGEGVKVTQKWMEEAENLKLKKWQYCYPRYNKNTLIVKDEDIEQLIYIDTDLMRGIFNCFQLTYVQKNIAKCAYQYCKKYKICSGIQQFKKLCKLYKVKIIKKEDAEMEAKFKKFVKFIIDFAIYQYENDKKDREKLGNIKDLEKINN